MGSEMCIRDRNLGNPVARLPVGETKRDDRFKQAGHRWAQEGWSCLLYTSDAADERSSVDLGGRRIIKKKTINNLDERRRYGSIG